MRLSVVVTVALSLAAPALPVLAAPAQPEAVHAQPAVLTFNEATSRFEREMSMMALEMRQAGSVNQTRAIAAKYQPEADALADRIEARLAAQENVAGRYRDAADVRNTPNDARRIADRQRFSDRGIVPVSPTRQWSENRTAQILSRGATVPASGAF